MFAPLPEEFLGYLPRHPYLLIELQAIDPSLLPHDNVLSMIARFEQARSPEHLEELVASVAEWIERAGEPDLVDSFTAWITLVLAQRISGSGRTLKLDVTQEEGAKMTTLIERARKWGEAERQEWLEKGIERGPGLRGRRELVYRLVTPQIRPRRRPSRSPRSWTRFPTRNESQPSRTQYSNAIRPRSSSRGRGRQPDLTAAVALFYLCSLLRIP